MKNLILILLCFTFNNVTSQNGCKFYRHGESDKAFYVCTEFVSGYNYEVDNWTGNSIDDLATGFGTVTISDEGFEFKYIGNMKDGFFDGLGTIYKKNKVALIFDDNNSESYETQIFDGNFSKGYFIDGKFKLDRTAFNVSEIIYINTNLFVNNFSMTYRGTFKDMCPYSGRIDYSNGDYLIGTFKNLGECDGQAIYYSRTRDKTYYGYYKSYEIFLLDEIIKENYSNSQASFDDILIGIGIAGIAVGIISSLFSKDDVDVKKNTYPEKSTTSSSVSYSTSSISIGSKVYRCLVNKFIFTTYSKLTGVVENISGDKIQIRITGGIYGDSYYNGESIYIEKKIWDSKYGWSTSDPGSCKK